MLSENIRVRMVLRIHGKAQFLAIQRRVDSLQQCISDNDRVGVRVNAKFANIKQGVKVATQQNAILNVVRAFPTIPSDVSRFKGIFAIAPGDSAAPSVCLQEPLSEMRLPTAYVDRSQNLSSLVSYGSRIKSTFLIGLIRIP